MARSVRIVADALVKRKKYQWMVVGLLLGLALGVGAYTFVYAKGTSYLTNNPSACANCHVMNEQYQGWIKSSHHAAATCNDCHAPASLVPKYLSKAENGFWHSLAFTTGRHPDPIRIKPGNRRITEDACRRCHADMVDAIKTPPGSARHDDATSCLRCHASVGHP